MLATVKRVAQLQRGLGSYLTKSSVGACTRCFSISPYDGRLRGAELQDGFDLQKFYKDALNEIIIPEDDILARPPRERKVDEEGRAHAVGRRKTSSARVVIVPGSGKLLVNGKELVDYFPEDYQREDVLHPFFITGTLGHFDTLCNVRGGGTTGHSQAIRHGLARALQNFNPDFRFPLKAAGLMTRDPRMVERKKAGQKKARKKFQWVRR